MSPPKKPADQARRLVLLVGRPGSGKADYAKTLDGFQVLPAREGASLAAAKRELAAAIAAGTPRLVINQTNASRRDRAAHLDPAKAAGYHTTIVWLDIPRETCERVACRRSSGALPTAAVARALVHFDDVFEPPTAAEADELRVIRPETVYQVDQVRQAAASPTTPPATGTISDKVLLLLVSGAGDASISEGLSKLDVPPDQRQALIAAARRRITLAADYHRDHELGQAIVRLNDCYRRSLAVQDAKTALAAQKELNKLMDLYTKPENTAPAESDSQAAAELEAVGRHLLPLRLAASDSPLEEHARLAALRILERET
jgi:predicted kinase